VNYNYSKSNKSKLVMQQRRSEVLTQINTRRQSNEPEMQSHFI